MQNDFKVRVKKDYWKPLNQLKVDTGKDVRDLVELAVLKTFKIKGVKSETKSTA